MGCSLIRMTRTSSIVILDFFHIGKIRYGKQKTKGARERIWFSCTFASVEFVFCLWLYYSTALIAFIEKIGHPETVIFLFSLPTEKFCIGNFIFESPSKKSHTKIRNHSRAIDKIRHPFYNKKYSKTFLPERSLFDEKCLSILSGIPYASTVLFI